MLSNLDLSVADIFEAIGAVDESETAKSGSHTTGAAWQYNGGQRHEVLVDSKIENCTAGVHLGCSTPSLQLFSPPSPRFHYIRPVVLPVVGCASLTCGLRLHSEGNASRFGAVLLRIKPWSTPIVFAINRDEGQYES
jgi:hypothetical protein